MSRFKHSIAHLFLYVIAVMMMHGAVPHVHHEHDGNEAGSQAVEHHHHHSGKQHSHSHDNEDKHQNKDFFSLFFGLHAHTHHSTGHIFLPGMDSAPSKIVKQKVKVGGNCPTSFLQELPLRVSIASCQRNTYLFEFLPSGIDLLAHPHRGPPVWS